MSNLIKLFIQLISSTKEVVELCLAISAFLIEAKKELPQKLKDDDEFQELKRELISLIKEYFDSAINSFSGGIKVSAYDANWQEWARRFQQWQRSFSQWRA